MKNADRRLMSALALAVALATMGQAPSLVNTEQVRTTSEEDVAPSDSR